MNPQEFHPDQFARGGRYSLDLEFECGGHALTLPVLLTRGAADGRTLVVTAGVHGDEYEGVRTLLDLHAQLDPAEMAGNLLAVPVANLPAFWNRTRTSPLDGANLARVFPGRPDGMPTEAIAYWLDQVIFPHADLYLDLHSGGVKVAMPTLAGYETGDARSREAAFAFGAPVVWAHPTVPPGRTVSAVRARGIPNVYAETRGAGRIHPGDLAIYVRGVRNLLRHLAILPGAPDCAAPEYHLIGNGDIDESATTSNRGFLIPRVELLQRVERDEELGVLVDPRGNPIERFVAPRAGIVVLIHAMPVVDAGEPVFLVTGVHP